MTEEIRSIDARLSDIVEWGKRIAIYLDATTFDQFLGDTKTQDAVIRCLEVIGEASAQILRVESDFETQYPNLELAAAYRARNRTSHGYGSVDMATIWRSTTVSCPQIVAAAKEVLAERLSRFSE